MGPDRVMEKIINPLCEKCTLDEKGEITFPLIRYINIGPVREYEVSVGISNQVGEGQVKPVGGVTEGVC